MSTTKIVELIDHGDFKRLIAHNHINNQSVFLILSLIDRRFVGFLISNLVARKPHPHAWEINVFIAIDQIDSLD
jgi:hypothetical protein